MDDSKEFQLMLDKAIESEPLAFKDFDRTKNVQDQLQAMIKITHPSCSPIDDAARAYFFHSWMTENDGSLFGYGSAPLFNPSMEQLWLSYVMSERYQKIWDGSDWIKKADDISYKTMIKIGQLIAKEKYGKVWSGEDWVKLKP